MNDGVRRSLLAAKIAQMQAEDERELAKGNALGLRSAEAMARPGWGSMTPEDRSSTAIEIQANRSALDTMLQRAQEFRGSMQQEA